VPPARARSGLRRWLAGGALALCGCTAADNLSYGEITAELDAIVRLPSAAADRQVGYRDRAVVSTWYMRSPLSWPLRWPLGALFGAARETDLDNPVGHVRELLAELPDEVGELGTASDAAVRLLLLVELDAGLGVRVQALTALARLVELCELAPFAKPAQAFQGPAGSESAAAAIAATRLLVEGEATALAGPEAAARMQQALAAAGERPLPTSRERLQWVHDLGAAYRDRGRRALRPLVEPWLRTALCQAYEALLLDLVGRREPQLTELRLLALQLVRGGGGPAVVPWLLAHLAAPAAEVARGGSRFDPDPLLQLRLIHLCGQLRGDLALQAVRLPGREAWDALAPAEFLAQTILNEADFTSPLRTPALAALTLCLERPRHEFDLTWVRAWHLERLRLQ
jgi:hypothetical protein